MASGSVARSKRPTLLRISASARGWPTYQAIPQSTHRPVLGKPRPAARSYELGGLPVAAGAGVPARDPPPPPPGTRVRRVVLGISGAIAAVDAPALTRGLQASGCDVRVALTRSAARLVSRAALD